jgi:hypothetical protein
MNADKVDAVLLRIQAIESDLAALRHTIDAETLSAGDHQYLSRCFDLLTMEVDALRQYLRGVVSV